MEELTKKILFRKKEEILEASKNGQINISESDEDDISNAEENQLFGIFVVPTIVKVKSVDNAENFMDLAFGEHK